MSRRGGSSSRGRGKKSQKGRNRQFTSPEEMDRQMKEEKESWREKKEDGSDEEDTPVRSVRPGDLPPSDSETESSSEEEEEGKAKGVSHLIEIQNPNRVVQKSKKASQVDVEQSGTQALTRREREQIEKEQARQRYQKLHQEGKTTEAQGDLARLAIIKKQREEAQKKRDAEKKAKEVAAAKAKKK